MSSFHFMIQRLANIMNKACPLSEVFIDAQFSCHNTCQLGHFNGMAQNIQQFIEVADKLSKIMKQILIETTQVHQVKKQFEATSSNTE